MQRDAWCTIWCFKLRTPRHPWRTTRRRSMSPWVAGVIRKLWQFIATQRVDTAIIEQARKHTMRQGVDVTCTVPGDTSTAPRRIHYDKHLRQISFTNVNIVHQIHMNEMQWQDVNGKRVNEEYRRVTSCLSSQRGNDFCLSVCLRQCLVAQAGLELSVQSSMTMNFWSPA